MTAFYLRRFFLIFFLIVLSCSKYEDEVQYKLKAYEISVDSSDGGAVSYEGGSLEAGSSLTISATPNKGFKFIGWSGDATGNENPLTLEVYSDLSITAIFERIKHTLAVAIEGSGQVSKTIISSAKGEEYNQGTVVRLTAIPDSGSVFTTWSGSSTKTFSEIDITLDGPKTVTATFEEQIFDFLDEDNVFIGAGRWKIRRPNTGNRDSGKSLVCELSESIYRPDGTFTVLLNDKTINGTYEVKDIGNLIYNIILMVNETNWGRVEDLVITKNYTSFKLISNGCDNNFVGDRDKDYDPKKDPYVCKIESSLSSGPQSQTVTQTQAIADVEYEFTTDCNEPLTASAFNLPPGVTMTFNNNIAKISGSPTDQATGTYAYVISVNNSPTASSTASAVQATTSSTIGGSITIQARVISTCTISSTLVSGPVTQTVTQTLPIQNVTYQFTTNNCTDTLSATASNLPPGVTMNFSNNQAVISGTPTNQASGTYNYGIIASNLSTSTTVSGSISLVVSSTLATSTTSTNSNIYFENGTCKCPNANVGDTATISGTLYTVVDNSSFATQLTNGNSNLCTTKVTNMSGSGSGGPFQGGITAGNLNITSIDISFWDTSNVTDMKWMFFATDFNQDISNWDTSSVTDMSYMFRFTNNFNKNIGSWDTSNVVNMKLMFFGALAFNQNIGNWDVSNVTDMEAMFNDARVFNQDLSSWCVSKIGTIPTAFVAPNSVFSISNYPKWGKEFTISLTNGSQSQTVTATNAIIPIQYKATPICNGATSINASNLPIGVTATLNNNVIDISGTPTAQSSGTYSYSLTVSGTTRSSIVTGTISVLASSTLATSTTCSISITGIQGPQSQTVSQSVAIQNVTYQFASNNCTDTLSATASNLPPGVTMNFSNNQAVISGTPSNQASGTYNYGITASNSSTSTTVSGTISVVVSSTTSTNTNIYFENGTCKCPNANVGDTATISGTLYTVVDNSTIQNQVNAGNINLCTTKVTDMRYIFQNKSAFNVDINFWDTSNVTNMADMFGSATSFNQSLDKWNVSSVTTMINMFSNATAFNGNIDTWDVSSVTNMGSMFNSATSFNKNINGWNVSNVTEMNGMFLNASSFNQPLNSWNTSSLNRMSRMFQNATSFNQSINSWNISSVTALDNVFDGATSFNQPLNSWNTSNVTIIEALFKSTPFNQDISNWNVSSVTNMEFTFNNAQSFNQNIGGWNTSSVTGMTSMLQGASSFNQNLSGWCVKNITSQPNNFAASSALSVSNLPTEYMSEDHTKSISDRL